MTTIQLSSHQADTLVTVLRSYLSDLRMEISHTDSMDFKEGLKDREMVIKQLLEQLPDGAEV